jgi:DNA mismatch repair protein MSH4
MVFLTFLLHFDVATLNTRHEAVEEICSDETRFFDLKNGLHCLSKSNIALSPFKDIDHIISQLVQVPKTPSIKLAESSINLTITVKYVIKLV